MKNTLTTNENAKKTILAVLFNFAVMVFSSSIILAYGIGDDFLFSQYIADGYCNIVFSNFFLFKFISLISNIIYPLNAYAIVTLAFSFISFTVISKVLLNKYNTTVSFVIIMLIYAFFANYHYNMICFTNMPPLLTAAGMLAIIHYCEKRKTIGVIIGSCLVIIGCAYRFSAFKVSAFISVVFIVAKAFDDNKKDIKAFIKDVFEPKRITALIVTAAICLSVNYASAYINNSTEELKYYSEYTHLRNQVWDYKLPDYNTYEKEYNDIGFDENDLKIMRYGLFDDSGAFTREKLIKLDEFSKSKKQSLGKIGIKKATTLIIDEIKTLKRLNSVTLFYIIIVISFATFFIITKRKYFFTGILLLITCAALNFYIIFLERNISRAMYAFWFPAIIYLFMLYDKDNIKPTFIKLYKNKKRIIIALCCTLSVIMAGLGIAYSDIYSIYSPSVKQKCSELYSYFSEHPENRYELTISADIHDGNHIYNNALHINKMSSEQNYKFFNCTYYNLPYDKEMCNSIFGTENMFSNLLNENVYFVTLHEEGQYSLEQRMKIYLEKYYTNGNNVSVEKVDSVGKYDIYKYIIKNNT